MEMSQEDITQQVIVEVEEQGEWRQRLESVSYRRYYLFNPFQEIQEGFPSFAFVYTVHAFNCL